MTINGINYLLLEKRGCEFFKGDPIRERSDMENYRVFMDIRHADGYRICGDLLRGNLYDFTKKNPPLINDCILSVDLQSGHLKYTPSIDPRDYLYTKSDVLRFVNKMSGNSFDDIKWVQRFDVCIDKGANFTPSSLIHKWANKNRLKTYCSYGDTIVEMYTGKYKYLCYEIKSIDEKTDRVTLTMEEAHA